MKLAWFISRLLVNDSKWDKNIHAICCVIFYCTYIVNFDLLIAMLLNNCCKIIVSSCNLTIGMHIHGKVSKKSAFFFVRANHRQIELTDWVFEDYDTRFIMRCHYVPRCGYTFYTLLCKQKNAVDIWPRCLSRLDEIWLNACIGILTNIK